MISIKSEKEIELMRKAGNLVSEMHKFIKPYIKAGITTKELDKLCHDFIIDNDDGRVYVNEINTIPGSFAFYLWSYNNEMTYSQLIDEIIEIAFEEHAEKLKNTFTYKSAIIDNQSISGIKAGKLGG